MTILVKRNMVCVSDSAEIQDGQARFFRNLRQRDAEKNRKHRDLQNLVFAHRFYDIFREDVQQKIIPPQRWYVLRGLLGGDCGQCQSHSGARQVDCADAKEQARWW